MSATDAYLTLATPGEAQLVEKRSRFIAYARHVENEDAAKAFVAEIRKQYYDARHVCYAYAFGTDVWAEDYDPIALGTALTRQSDDGEPGGSAGKPILGQLRARRLTQTAVIVVRYFGGVKLGTGGLAVAYKTAAGMALDAATITEKIMMDELRVEAPYADQDVALRAIRDAGADILARDYTSNSVILTLGIRQSLMAGLRQRLEKIYTLSFRSW